jgi:hypothetical protein
LEFIFAQKTKSPGLSRDHTFRRDIQQLLQCFAVSQSQASSLNPIAADQALKRIGDVLAALA